MSDSHDRNSEYHTARLLLLLDALTRPRRRLVGLTKLAKLDFLLRYPAMLDRLLERDGIPWPPGAEPTDTEQAAVESRMIRYKYGPWDDAYYPLIGSLVGRALVETDRDSRGTLRFRLTPLGRTTAEQLQQSPEWATVALRSRLLRQHFDTTGNQLRERIYVDLPDVVDRPHRTEI